MISQASEIFSVWITSRALGLSAYLLFFLAMATGMIQSMKGVLPAFRSAVAVIHQTSSWLGWLFSLSHVLLLVFDDYVGFTLTDLWIPFSSKYEPLAVSMGIIAMYLMLLLVVSSDMMKTMGRKWWRAIHGFSFLGFALSLYHGISFSGTVQSPMTPHLYVVTVSILLFLGIFRYFHAKVPERKIGRG